MRGNLHSIFIETRWRLIMVKVSEMGLIGTKDVLGLKIKTDDEIIDFDVFNDIRILEEEKVKIKISFQLHSQELVKRVKDIKKATIYFDYECKSYEDGSRYFKELKYENMTFHSLERFCSCEKVDNLVLIFKEE